MHLNLSEQKSKIGGAALVEFAIILPVLMAIVLGIVEFSYGFARYNSLNKATQEGARYFSDPLHARNGDISTNIDVSNANSYVGNTRGFIASYDTVILSSVTTTDNCNNLTQPGICIASLNLSNSDLPLTWDHINVTTTYTHTFIVVNALSGMVSLMIGSTSNFGPSINMTASAVLRVQ